MIDHIKKYVCRASPRNAFVRNVTTLVGGTAVSQLLLILASPVLTRLYRPDDFGLLAVYVSLLALIGVISTLRYEQAIPLPRSDVEAANVVTLCLGLVCVSTLFTVILIIYCRVDVESAINVPGAAQYLWMLPVGVFLGGVYRTLNLWSVRTRQFGTISETKILQSLVTILIQIGAFKAGGGAIIAGQVIGQGVGIKKLTTTNLKNTLSNDVYWATVKRVFYQYKSFPLYSCWGAFALTASLHIPPLIIASIFGASTAGLYALAIRTVTLPAYLIGGAVRQVFLSRVSETLRRGQLQQLTVSVHTKLAQLFMVPTVILAIFAPDLFTVVYGKAWTEAGVMAAWMAPWLYFQCVSAPISSVFSATERQHKYMVFQFVLLLGRIAAVYIGSQIGNAVETIAILSTVSTFGYIFLLLWVARVSGVSYSNIVLPTLASFAHVSILMSPLIVLAALEIKSAIAWISGLAIVSILLGRRIFILSKELF